MIARRQVLVGGAAMGLATATAGWSAIPGTKGIFLYDRRIAGSRAAALTRTGAELVDTGRDLASLWYGGLRDRAGTLALAGCTAYADLVIMQGIAREERRRIAIASAAPTLWSWTLE
jgi:hypothetical protein